jgi:hypothetical protein
MTPTRSVRSPVIAFIGLLSFVFRCQPRNIWLGSKFRIISRHAPYFSGGIE